MDRRKKTYDIIGFLCGLSVCCGCSLEGVRDMGDSCPPKDQDGILLYIDTPDCTANSCPDHDYSKNFEFGYCPSNFPVCAPNGSSNSDEFHCEILTRCADNQFLCRSEDNQAGTCVDPSRAETCGALEDNCEEGAPYGGIDCTQYGAAICKQYGSSFHCECANGAMSCGESCIDYKASATCGADDCDADNFGGDNCDLYDDNRECREKEDGSWGCQCRADQFLCNYKCIDKCIGITKKNATGVACSSDEEGNPACTYECEDGYQNCGSAFHPDCVLLSSSFENCGICGRTCDGNQTCVNGTCIGDVCKPTECPTTIDGEAACVTENTLCGPKCDNCINIHDNAMCLLGKCVISQCKDDEHPEFTDTQITSCIKNTADSCASPTMKISESPVNCNENKPANASEMDCLNGACIVKQCDSGFYVNSDMLSCVAGNADACGSGSSNTVNCNLNIPNGAAVMGCDNGTCIVAQCNQGYHISGDHRSCVLNSPSECGNVNNTAAVNCDANKPANAVSMACDNGSCKVTACTGGNHVTSDRNGCEPNSNSACGPSSWDGRSDYASYVKACTSPAVCVADGTCNCVGYPENVLNFNGKYCVPRICMGVPGIKKGERTTLNPYGGSDDACKAVECDAGFDRYYQGQAAACRPIDSSLCSAYGYANNSSPCNGCYPINGAPNCGASSCNIAAGYRYFCATCQPADSCCGMSYYDDSNPNAFFTCYNCLKDGLHCNTIVGRCE